MHLRQSNIFLPLNIITRQKLIFTHHRYLVLILVLTIRFFVGFLFTHLLPNLPLIHLYLYLIFLFPLFYKNSQFLVILHLHWGFIIITDTRVRHFRQRCRPIEHRLIQHMLHLSHIAATHQ